MLQGSVTNLETFKSMENLSLSRKPNRGSSQPLLTNRTTTSNGAITNFSNKTMYDDVFGGSPRFGAFSGPDLSPRPEDYIEIFGGFHACRGASIPVLDLPLVDNDNDNYKGVMFDVRNPKFNYGDVFGGFDGIDFAASYEDLMMLANGCDDDRDRDCDVDGDSSEWMEAETESLSEGSDLCGTYQYVLNGGYYEPIDSSMELNMPYHNANLRSDGDMSNEVKQVAQLDADPEFTCMIETPLLKADNKNLTLHGTDDIDFEISGGITKEKRLRGIVSHPSSRTAGGKTNTNDWTQIECGRNGTCSDEMFVTASDINLRTVPLHVPPPSRPPPLVNVKSGDYQNDQNSPSEGRMGDSSPPSFVVEIDASSTAVASAAAMKEAMDKAQVKLKNAKLLERKREGIKTSKKLGSKSDGRDIKDERVQRMYGNDNSGMKVPVKEERQKAVKTEAPDSLEREKLCNVPQRFAVEMHGKESQLLQEFNETDGADEWQEAAQFVELVRTDKLRKGFERTNNENVLVQCMESHELQPKAKQASIRELEQQLESDMKIEAVRENHELEKVERDKKTAKGSCESAECIAITKSAEEAFTHKGHENKVKAAQKATEMEENGQFVTERKPLENGKKPTGADELGNELEAGLAMQWKENGQQEKEISKSSENLKRVQGYLEREDEKNSWREGFGQEKSETKHDEILVKTENEKRLREGVEQEEKEKRLKEASEREEKEKKEQVCELEESERIWRMALEQLENEKILKQARLQEENERGMRNALEQEDTEKKQREACEKDECNRRAKKVTEQGKNERHLKEVLEREETVNRLEVACEKEKTAKRLKEVCEKENIEKMPEEAIDQKDYSKQVKEIQDIEDEMEQKVVEQEETEEVEGENYVYRQIGRDESGKNQKIAQGTHQYLEGEHHVVSDVVNKLDYSCKRHANQLLGNNDKNCVDLEETEEFILVENGKKPKAAKAYMLEGKRRTHRSFQHVKISRSSERKDENIDSGLTLEEEEAERLKRERELENERLRTIEEEREREREREKDRMAVDRTVLEACERAEGAALERAMEEEQDRLEKACAKARDKSSMEARLRAERAAVERATAEARERAVEKAMAERAAFEAKDRVERSMSDEFSTSSRNSRLKTNSLFSDLQDQHFQGTGTFDGLQYPYDSVDTGVEGEPAQRCKARLERHQRTAERAAKALEEKNMCDLIVQRELAERNRLAEMLDADVKRWSSGKEGNLRALLSTLQYILGPESSWHPIPLTEVITSAAVKKGYRKATLCVHPDKLQQRGASVRQKYICEKVFDLLKEAWNKFNSEER